ncbi:VENN motif pre-toxin domain-containing protein, partial [Bergeriella denitrificans]
TEKAEAAGNNQFQTASLSSSDIQNHSRYEGESFGVGASGAAYGGWDGKTVDKDGKATHSAARTMGYGSDGDSQNSTTYSGIGTRNIHITDDSSGTQADTVYTDTRTEAAEAQSGRLKNVFDKERVQNELDLQREVSQQFSRNVQEVNREINRHIDDLLKQKEAGNINDTDYQKELDKLQYLKTGLNMVAAGLSAPTDSAAGIAAATVSPAIAYEIGQQFKNLAKENADGKLSTKQEAAHILAHAVLGAAVAAAGGNDAMMAAVAAGGAEAAAPVVSKWLYGEADGSQLTAEQKETVAAIAGLAGAAVGATAGNAADAAQGS